MTVLRILVCLAVGALTAAIYISALDWDVRLYLERRARWSAVLVHAARLFLVCASFTLCAFQGALPLLSSLAGFHVIRTVAVSRRSLAKETGA